MGKSFGFSLLPQEDRFYDLLGESSELAYGCVQLLKKLVGETDRENRLKLGRDIQTIKDRAKVVTVETTQKLCQTFITPFDREDIHNLIWGLYSIPKMAVKAQARLIGFDMCPFENDLFQLTDNMGQAAEHLHDLLQQIKTLKHGHHAHDKTALLHNIENQTDLLLDQLMVTLFEKEPDVKQVILRREIYHLFEAIVDKQRDIGNFILEIVLKHA